MINRQTVLDIAKRNNEPSWLVERRLRAYEQFEHLSIPSFSFDNVNPLDSHDETVMSPVNGVVILSFQDAMRQHEDILKKHLLMCVKPENKFAALHEAVFTYGTLVYIPKDTKALQPIKITLHSHSKIQHFR